MSDNIEAFGANAKELVKSIVERVERLEEEKKTLGEDIKDVYDEAKCHGLEPKVLREIVRRRKKDQEELAEFEALLDTYLAVFG